MKKLVLFTMVTMGLLVALSEATAQDCKSLSNKEVSENCVLAPGCLKNAAVGINLLNSGLAGVNASRECDPDDCPPICKLICEYICSEDGIYRISSYSKVQEQEKVNEQLALLENMRFTEVAVREEK
jgi:hypothetical protein